MDYTEICAMKARLGLSESNTSADDVLTMLIHDVSEWIDAYCGRTFGEAEYTHFLEGNGAQLIKLPQWPVYSITSLYFDAKGYWGDAPDAFAADKLLVEGVNYALKRDQPDGSSASGLIYRIDGVWERPFSRAASYGAWGLPLASLPPVRVGNIKVTYTAGSVPGAVKLATETAVARLWRAGKYGAAVQGETTPKYSYTLATMNPDDLLGPAKGLLATVKEFVF